MKLVRIISSVKIRSLFHEVEVIIDDKTEEGFVDQCDAIALQLLAHDLFKDYVQIPTWKG